MNFLWININANLGDNTSSPLLYFKDFCGAKRVNWNDQPDANEPLIIGGGGLLLEGTKDYIKRICIEHKNQVILWGVGTNNGYQDYSYPDWLDFCSLVGLRDYPTRFDWVPCSSCMNPLFDSSYRVDHDVVGYFQANYPIELGISTKINLWHVDWSLEQAMETAIKHLGSGHTVITNSYHGAYWAALLGRKIIIMEPFSTKFFRMPWTVSFADRANWMSILRDAKSEGSILEKCRKANLEFLDKVKSQSNF